MPWSALMTARTRQLLTLLGYDSLLRRRFIKPRLLLRARQERMRLLRTPHWLESLVQEPQVELVPGLQLVLPSGHAQEVQVDSARVARAAHALSSGGCQESWESVEV
jgi:hypothetical protein